MAKIYNSDVTKGLAKNAGIQQNTDKTPNELAEKIVPVIETNPQLVKAVDVIKSSDKTTTDAVGAAIMTTSTGMDFYLTGLGFHLIKNAACDVASGMKAIYATINGEFVNLIRYAVLTLTAQEINIQVDFSKPIKIDRGTGIGYSSFAYAAGDALRTYTLRGYYIESRA